MNNHGVRRKFPVMRLTIPVLWAAVILWQSLTPNPPHPPRMLSWDKLQHAASYGLLTLLAGWAFGPLFSNLRRGWLWALFFAVAYGVAIELAQGLLSDVRVADPVDALANASGAATVFALARLRSALARRGRP